MMGFETPAGQYWPTPHPPQASHGPADTGTTTTTTSQAATSAAHQIDGENDNIDRACQQDTHSAAMEGTAFFSRGQSDQKENQIYTRTTHGFHKIQIKPLA